MPNGARYELNAENCIHRETCDIKDANHDTNWPRLRAGC
ncbi:4Fe-4S dicluster domain-containing protein [Microvirga zambiensis]